MLKHRLFWVISILLIVTLACGNDATPERVGSVNEAESQPEPTEVVVEASQAESQAEEPTESPPPTDTPVPEPQAYAVGDIVSIGDSVLVVLGWEEVAPTDIVQPDEGMRFIGVEVLLVNQSDQAVNISSLLQMDIVDETGELHDANLSANLALDNAGVDGELSSGERIRGKVGFQIPETAQGLQFVFNDNIFGSGRVFVDLGPQPVTVEPPAEIAGEIEQQTFNVGEIVAIGDSVLVLLGWDNVEPTDFANPDQGNKFIAVEVLIVNQGDSSANISSGLQMNLKDSTGQSYDVDIGANTAIDSADVSGELLPGERIRGKMGFQVPEDVQGLTFVFDASVFGTGKVNINLGPAPVSLEPPAEVIGETAQETFAVGDVIEIGDLTIAINEVTFPPGNDFAKPDEGNKFVALNVTIANQGSDAANISSLLQMSLKDATGQSYDLDVFATSAAGEDTPDGEILPGTNRRGWVGFEVPQDVTGLVFVFDASIFGSGKVLVALE